MINPKVDAFIADAAAWNEELSCLRNFLQDTLLTEEFKWGVPCYTYQKNNVVLIHGFKHYCAILFVKGALLSDSEKVLVRQSEETQASRQIRFTNVQEIIKLEPVIKSYVYEAIEIEKAGLKVEFTQSKNLEFSEELLAKFESDAAYKTAFLALTPGRQRAYNLHFNDAKQTATRLSRIEKTAFRVLRGKGLTDCVCGLSKKMPGCDGSHKSLKQNL